MTLMPRLPNKKTDVFLHINMHGNDPNVCWEWTRVTKGGGRDGRPYFDVGGKKYLAYRIVYELFNGVELSDDVLVRHKCDNGGAPVRCCNPHHLELGTHEDNMNDMKYRERHGLPHHVVKNIKRLIKQGRDLQEIADLYGMSRENVSAIANERSYKHVKLDEDTDSNESST